MRSGVTKPIKKDLRGNFETQINKMVYDKEIEYR